MNPEEIKSQQRGDGSDTLVTLKTSTKRIENIDYDSLPNVHIYKALAAFQQECEPIEKSSKGYNYNYAGLPEIMKAIKPLLKKHNLGITQTFDGYMGTTSLVTTLFHTESGQTITSEIKIPEMIEAKQNAYQTLGSGITYLKRYSISAILGLVTDDDTDANDIQVQPIKNTTPNDDPFA